MDVSGGLAGAMAPQMLGPSVYYKFRIFALQLGIGQPAHAQADLRRAAPGAYPRWRGLPPTAVIIESRLCQLAYARQLKPVSSRSREGKWHINLTVA